MKSYINIFTSNFLIDHNNFFFRSLLLLHWCTSVVMMCSMSINVKFSLSLSFLCVDFYNVTCTWCKCTRKMSKSLNGIIHEFRHKNALKCRLHHSRVHLNGVFCPCTMRHYILLFEQYYIFHRLIHVTQFQSNIFLKRCDVIAPATKMTFSNQQNRAHCSLCQDGNCEHEKLFQHYMSVVWSLFLCGSMHSHVGKKAFSLTKWNKVSTY